MPPWPSIAEPSFAVTRGSRVQGTRENIPEHHDTGPTWTARGEADAPRLTHGTPAGLDGKKGSWLGDSLAGLTLVGLAAAPWQAWVDIGWCVPPQGSRNIRAEDNGQRGGHMAKDVSPPVPTHHAGLSSKSAAFQCAIELFRGRLNQKISPRT